MTGIYNPMEAAMRGYGFAEGVATRREDRATAAEERTRQRTRQDEADARAKESHGLALEASNLTIDDARHKQDLRRLKVGASQLEAGIEPTGDIADTVRRYFGDATDADMVEADRNLTIIEKAAESGDIRAFNTPEVLAAFNDRYRYDINSDRNMQPIGGSRSVTGIYPGENKGTLVFDLSGQDAGGKAFSGEAMTTGRGSAADGDNEVLQQDVGPIIKKATAQRKLLDIYKQDPGGFRQYMEGIGAKDKKEKKKVTAINPGQGLVNEDGEVIREPNAEAFRSGGGAMPSEAKLIEYYVRNGIAADHKEAQAMVANAKMNPQAEAAKIAKLYLVDYKSEEENAEIFKRRYEEALTWFGGPAQPVRPTADPQGQPAPLPPEALQALHEGKVTRFKNGQQWTIQNGKPVRVE